MNAAKDRPQGSPAASAAASPYVLTACRVKLYDPVVLTVHDAPSAESAPYRTPCDIGSDGLVVRLPANSSRCVRPGAQPRLWPPRRVLRLDQPAVTVVAAPTPPGLTARPRTDQVPSPSRWVQKSR